ncbi:hypothetical protein GLOTRDRAFT_89914 [Gloeophyllum trabeum ATCC 11539]|uniref:Uncharacterized protein n=1 Tax=Gloeophyllum trabeum (strain ATCC 11539 / FP-39264 / Madison 617) TaxID=670483 RepID=S7QKR1_GLOTA|nr:uncharacterized protein GLOTRDRAFT_89914 [Gloeophyllum trabeum ATCC 11539]EPQ60386.1 hypothetical protein GLOTRDRAFT_89914 [Gloeophyllum trabeum ATCC 11539]
MSSSGLSPRLRYSTGDCVVRPPVHRQSSAHRGGERRLSEADIGYPQRIQQYLPMGTNAPVDQFSPEVDYAWSDGSQIFTPKRCSIEEADIDEDVKRALMFQRRARQRKASATNSKLSIEGVEPGLSPRSSVSSKSSRDSDELCTPRTSISSVSYTDYPEHHTHSKARASIAPTIHDHEAGKPPAAQPGILGIPISTSPKKIEGSATDDARPRKGSVSFILGEVSKRLGDSARFRRHKGSSGSRSRSSSILHSLMRTPASQSHSPMSPPAPRFPTLETIPSQDTVARSPRVDNAKRLGIMPHFNPFIRTRAESTSALEGAHQTHVDFGAEAPTRYTRRFQSSPPPHVGSLHKKADVRRL